MKSYKTKNMPINRLELRIAGLSYISFSNELFGDSFLNILKFVRINKVQF